MQQIKWKKILQDEVRKRGDIDLGEKICVTCWKSILKLKEHFKWRKKLNAIYNVIIFRQTVPVP